MKAKKAAKVISQKCLAPGIYDMWLETDLAKEAHAGQFIAVYPKDRSTLLPRPISICEVKEDGSALRLVYRVAGKGTGEFSTYEAGDETSILGILGNGYDITLAKGKKVFLMGGGIGVPPMLQLAKALYLQNEEMKKAGAGEEDLTKIQVIVGYRDSQMFLKEDLEKYAEVYVATEDGSFGAKGNVMNAIETYGLSADMICTCGPMPMLRAIKKYAEEKEIPAYLSLEERMACGVGACLGCVVKTKEVDHHSHVNNARICTDGPVFECREVEI